MGAMFDIDSPEGQFMQKHLEETQQIRIARQPGKSTSLWVAQSMLDDFAASNAAAGLPPPLASSGVPCSEQQFFAGRDPEAPHLRLRMRPERRNTATAHRWAFDTF